MTQRVLFNDAEVVEATDLTEIGATQMAAVDQLIRDAIGYPAHWAAFTVSQVSAQIVRISAGRYHTAEKVFASSADTDLNLQIHIPVAASDQRWVALILRGTEKERTAQRIFETSADVETSQPVEQTAPKLLERVVSFTVQQGAASPAPALRPAIAQTDAVIAWVLLKSTGIFSIEPGETARVKTLYEVEKRLATVEVDLSSLFERTASIETDISNIAARLSDIPRPALMRQIQRNLGQLNQQVVLPEEARASRFDPGLTYDLWDPQHAGWLARVKEGIHFPYASQQIAQLALANEDDPSIAIRNRRMIPAFDEVERISNIGRDSSVNISQLTHTVVTAVKQEVARSRVVLGTSELVCTNSQYWATMLAGVQIGQIFTLNGETFLLEGSNGMVHYSGEDKYRHLRRVITEQWSETYWTYESEEVGLNGSIYAQSFLCSQPMVATSIELDFERVGATGDVFVLLVETGPSAAPIFTAVIASATKTRDQLTTGWNKFEIDFTLLDAGKRYAWVSVTTGNHALYATTGNKFTGGTRFACTDGVFAQGDLTSDFAFKINAARFRQPRTVLEFDPITLTGGMTNIEMVMKSWQPGATALEWEYRPTGQTTWYTIEDDYPGGGHPLAGLPALCGLRLVMIGTADLAPMVVLDNKLKCVTGRNRSEMKAVSDPIAFGLSTTSIMTQYLVDSFDPAIHTFTPKIIVGATSYTAAATTVTVDAADPKRRFIESTFTVPSTTNARMAPEMTTSNVVTVPFINNSNIIAI
ncbi:hypothetical protein AB4099_05535 [Bosea sp. 2KB_26]|uniref:hypothetical protein n=1 Tax=Bosea sp. 2KB_26 TaxID=3237475 RepID=UPI003F91E188